MKLADKILLVVLVFSLSVSAMSYIFSDSGVNTDTNAKNCVNETNAVSETSNDNNANAVSVAKAGQPTKGYDRFITVERYYDAPFNIICDKETLVLYSMSTARNNCGTLTLLVDSTGKPLTYKPNN